MHSLKTQAIFCLLFALLLLAEGHCQDYPSLNGLTKQYIKALKKQSTKEFDFTITEDSLLLENFSKRLGFDFKYALERDFVRVLKEGKSKGINWNQIKLITFDFTLERDGPFLIAQPVKIVFQHRLFRYAISMNCSKLNGSWSFVPIARQSELIELVPISVGHF